LFTFYNAKDHIIETHSFDYLDTYLPTVVGRVVYTHKRKLTQCKDKLIPRQWKHDETISVPFYDRSKFANNYDRECSVLEIFKLWPNMVMWEKDMLVTGDYIAEVVDDPYVIKQQHQNNNIITNIDEYNKLCSKYSKDSPELLARCMTIMSVIMIGIVLLSFLLPFLAKL
jgi:hypothetical protein